MRTKKDQFANRGTLQLGYLCLPERCVCVSVCVKTRRVSLYLQSPGCNILRNKRERPPVHAVKIIEQVRLPKEQRRLLCATKTPTVLLQGSDVASGLEAIGQLMPQNHVCPQSSSCKEERSRCLKCSKSRSYILTKYF